MSRDDGHWAIADMKHSSCSKGPKGTSRVPVLPLFAAVVGHYPVWLCICRQDVLAQQSDEKQSLAHFSLLH